MWESTPIKRFSDKEHLMGSSSSDVDLPGSNHSESSASEDTTPNATHPDYLRPPQLGIVHLLAWIAITSALLIWSSVVEYQSGSLSQAVWLTAARRALELVGYATVVAGIVGTTVIVRAKIQEVPGRLQPGHWFLLIQTLLTLASWLLWAVDLARWTADPSDRFWYWRYVFLDAVGLVSVAAWFMVAMWMQDCRCWRAAAWVLAIVSLFHWGREILVDTGLTTWSLTLPGCVPIGSFVLLPVFLVALRLDLRRGPRRDWLHWLGIGITLVYEVVGIGWWILQTIVLRELAS